MYGCVCRDYGSRRGLPERKGTGGSMYKNLLLDAMIAMGRPSYGYELRQRLAPVHDLFEITDGGIYAALGNLERSGLIRVVGDADGGEKQRYIQRKRYAVTADGIAHQQQWKETPASRSPMRHGIHMQLLVATEDDIPAVLASLDRFEQDCQLKIQQVFAAMKGMPDLPGAVSPWAIACLRNAFVAELQAHIEWAQRTADTLRNVVEGTRSRQLTRGETFRDAASA